MAEISDLVCIILDVSLTVEAGERIWIHGWDHTVELISLLAWECRKRGCHVLITVQPEDFWLHSIMEAPLELLEMVPAHEKAALKETDAYIFILGPKKPVPWELIPKERRKAVTVWLDTRYERNRFNEEWMTIAKDNKVRMLAIEATLATQERADALSLDYKEWRNVMFAGCVANYQDIAKRANALASVLGGLGEVHITTPHGTDVKLRLDMRPVQIGDGLATQEKAKKGLVTFLPSGSVEVAPREESAVGSLVYDIPIRVSGRGTIDDLAIKVKDGRIVEFSAQGRKDVFENYLKEGKGDVDRFASFGIGLNANLCYGYTQDDKVLGGVTVGFGDNTDKGGKNRANGKDWWASMTKATVTVDDTLVMRDGLLLI